VCPSNNVLLDWVYMGVMWQIVIELECHTTQTVHMALHGICVTLLKEKCLKLKILWHSS